MALVHPEVTAPRARPPVDALQSVARAPRADVRELDPFALRARDLVAGEHLRVGRLDDALEHASRGYVRNSGRVSAVVSQVEQPERVARAQNVGPITCPPQRCASERQLELPLLARGEAQRDRVAPFDERHAVRERGRRRPAGRPASSSAA